MSYPKMLFQFAARTADDRYGQCPPGKRWILTSLFACNTNGSTASVRVHHVSPGKSVGTGNALFYDVRLSANSTSSLLNGGDRIPVNANEELRGLASSTGVTITGYGIEETA